MFLSCKHIQAHVSLYTNNKFYMKYNTYYLHFHILAPQALVSDGIEGILLGAHVINDNSEIVEKNDAPVNYPGAWAPHKAYALRKHGFFVPPVTGEPVARSRYILFPKIFVFFLMNLFFLQHI